MTDRLQLVFLLLVSFLFAVSLSAQDDEPENILNLPAFGFLTVPENWQPLWDHPYAPAMQSPDGSITLRLQSGDTLAYPLTRDLVGTDPAEVLKYSQLISINQPRKIHFEAEDSMPLDGIVVELKLNETTNRLLVLALPPHQDYWYLITLDAPAEDWKAFLPQAEEILKTFHYIPNAPLLRVVLGYDLPEGAVLPRHELAALEVISQRLYELDLGVPFTVHLLPDQAMELGFYGGFSGIAEIAAWVSQVGFLELVDFSGVEQAESYLDAQILTTGQLDWEATNQPASAPSTTTPDEEAELHPVTLAPFETVITSADFTDAVAQESTYNNFWELEVRIAESAQDTMETFTRENTGEALAIVLDGHVLLMPRLQSELSESLLLSGQLPEDEIKRLAAIVNSGPLPVPMIVETIELLE